MGTIAEKLTYLNGTKTAIKNAIINKGVAVSDTDTFRSYASKIESMQTGGGLPTTSGGGLFTGATIPLTYYGNTHDYENNYEYKSANCNITISGLDGVATITGNGTKAVTVAFDVTSTTTALTEFTITLSDGTNTYEYKGLHAHYGSAVTGILTLAYTNIPVSGTGTIGTEYKFIVSSNLPCFSGLTTLWNTIYSYQVLNTLIGNYTGTFIGNDFLQYCYSFNQPITIPSGVTSLGGNFMLSCYSFNQPITIPSGVTNIGYYFLSDCYSFNQPITIPSGVTSIENYFLRNCYSFNQPLTIPSSVTRIVGNFMVNCYSFNQPLTIPSSVTSLGNYFLSHCYSFNQPLTIPSGVTSLGGNFLSYCYSFNQPLTIPSGVTSIGNYFLSYCYSLSTIVYESAVYPTDNYSLSQGNNSKTDPTNGAGIMVYGTNRAGILAALPNRTSSPYRLLKDGGV